MNEQALSQKRSRWAIFFEAGGGIGVGTYFGQETHPDISVLQYQGVFGGGIGGNFYLVDGCQSEKISRPNTCADVLLSAELGASYWFNSFFVDAQGRLGIEVDAFLGHQRAVALTAKVQLDTQYSGLRVRFDGFLVSTGLRYRF